MAARRVRAYIGLGANVGEAETTLAEAVTALAGLPGTRLGASRGSTPPRHGAIPTSQTSATPSWLWTCLLARTRRPARSTC